MSCIDGIIQQGSLSYQAYFDTDLIYSKFPSKKNRDFHSVMFNAWQNKSHCPFSSLGLEPLVLTHDQPLTEWAFYQLSYHSCKKKLGNHCVKKFFRLLYEAWWFSLGNSVFSTICELNELRLNEKTFDWRLNSIIFFPSKTIFRHKLKFYCFSWRAFMLSLYKIYLNFLYDNLENIILLYNNNWFMNLYINMINKFKYDLCSDTFI